MYRLLIQRAGGKVYANGVVRRCYSSSSSSSGGSNGLPPMQQAGFGKVIVFLAPLAVGGGLVAYANYDREFRKTLETNVPGAEPALKVLLQEEKPFEDLSKKIEEYTSTVTGFFGGSGEPAKEEPKPKKPVPITSTVGSKASPVSTPPPPPLAKPTTTTTTTASKKADSSAEIPRQAPPPLPKDLVDLEKLVETSSAAAIREYNRAVALLKQYNDEARKLVEEATDKLDSSAWTTLKNKTNARESAVRAAEKAAADAKQVIENIEKVLYKNDPNVQPEAKEGLKKKVRNVIDGLEEAKKKVYEVYEVADLTEKYWQKVEVARNHFIKDIEELFPSVNFSQKKLTLSKQDLNLFLVYAHTQVLACQKELQKLQTEGEQRLRRAIDSVRGGQDSDAIKAEVGYEVEKLRRQIALDNEVKLFKFKQERERLLNDVLKKQADAHIDHVKEALELKEKEMRRVFERELDEKLSQENTKYKQQLANMLGKIKGMDEALKARADSERSAHQAQHLWGACQALWSSVRAGQPGVSWKQNLRPLTTEIQAVKIAAEGDELVNVVINGLPDEAVKRGVYPADALRERFIRVDEVARRVAIVPESGAKLPIYILSYLQSLLIITPSNPISKDELQDKVVDFNQFDNYDILNRAKYWLDRGDLMQALKYMNMLTGASRKVASEWMKEARLLLETQQAANVLIAHAAGNSLRYL